MWCLVCAVLCPQPQTPSLLSLLLLGAAAICWRVQRSLWLPRCWPQSHRHGPESSTARGMNPSVSHCVTCALLPTGFAMRMFQFNAIMGKMPSCPPKLMTGRLGLT